MEDLKLREQAFNDAMEQARRDLGPDKPLDLRNETVQLAFTGFLAAKLEDQSIEAGVKYRVNHDALREAVQEAVKAMSDVNFLSSAEKLMRALHSIPEPGKES